MANFFDLIGRIMISAIFLFSGINKIFNYDGTVGWMEGFGIRGFLLVPAIVIELFANFAFAIEPASFPEVIALSAISAAASVPSAIFAAFTASSVIPEVVTFVSAILFIYLSYTSRSLGFRDNNFF